MFGVSLMPSTMTSSTNKLDNNNNINNTSNEIFVNAMTNLKLNPNILLRNFNFSNGIFHHQTNEDPLLMDSTSNNTNQVLNNSLTNNNNNNNSTNSALSDSGSAKINFTSNYLNITQFKSKFKTIKIFVASNKDG
jgi:hypothetical protein